MSLSYAWLALAAPSFPFIIKKPSVSSVYLSKSFSLALKSSDSFFARVVSSLVSSFTR